MQVELRAAARPHAQPRHRARHLLEVPGEVLAAAGLAGVAQHVGADRLDRVGEDARRDLLVDHRRHAAAVLHAVLDAQRRQQRRNDLAHNRFQRQPGVAARGADGAGQRAGLRDRVGGHARVDRAPHHHRAVARVDATRQHAGHTGDQRAEPVHQVAGQMRPRRVPAVRLQRDLDLIGRRRDRARPHRDLADRQPRVAVQREDPRHARQRTGRDRVDRAAGHQLLGGLEDQPHTDRQFGHRRQRQRRSEQDRGVRVVTAGMGDVGHHRRVRRAGPLGHRQRVHVGPQRDPRPVLGPEVAGQPCSAGQHLRVEARVGQMGGDELGGRELLSPQLGVGVDVPAPARRGRRSGRPTTARWRRRCS